MKYEITKGSEKDFEDAPESATVRIIESGFEDRFPIFADKFENCSTRTHCATGVYDSYIADVSNWSIIAECRPITEPVWDGEGLPPIGVECEFTSSSSGGVWHAGVVRYLSEHTIVIEFTDMVNGKAESISHPRTMKFRPLRSPEDVARDEAIEAMRDVGYTLPSAIRFTKEEMAALYDAGYRRPKPHADEVVACEHKSTRPSAGGCICNDCGWRSW